jgi:hypothetical protein
MSKISYRTRLAGSTVSCVLGVTCLWWGVLWLQRTDNSIVPSLDLVLLPLSDLVWVPGLGVLFLVGSVTFPLHRRIPDSEGLRAGTLATGRLLFGFNMFLVLLPITNAFYGAIYMIPLTATGLLLLGIGTTGWVIKPP